MSRVNPPRSATESGAGEPAPERPGCLSRSLPSTNVLILLTLLLVLGMWLRFAGLGFQSFGLDELWTWQMANKETLRDVLTTGRLPVDVHPPLYFMIQYFFQKVLGDSEALVRLPAALAGVFSVLAIYLLGRRLYGDTEGLIAAALMAVQVRPIFYSQEARAYSMLILFSMLSVYFAIPVVRSLLRKRFPDVRPVVGYVLSTVVLSTIHYHGLYFVALQGLAAGVLLLVKRPRGLLVLPLLYLPIALAYIPWLPIMLKSMKTMQINPNPPSRLAFVRFLEYVFNRPWRFWWLALASCAWLLGVTVYERVNRKDLPGARPATPHAGMLLVLWLVVPFVAVHLQAALWRSTFTLRNMLICTAPAYLLVARGVARIPVRSAFHALIGTAVTAMLLVQLLFVMQWYSQPTKSQFREAVAYVVQNEGKYPNAMIVGWDCMPDFYNYYFVKMGSTRRVNVWAYRTQGAAMVTRGVQVLKPEYIWLIWSHWKLDEDFLAFMKERYSLVAEKSFLRAGVLFFKNEPPARQR